MHQRTAPQAGPSAPRGGWRRAQPQRVACAPHWPPHAPALAIGLVPPAMELFLARHSMTRSSPDSFSFTSLRRARGARRCVSSGAPAGGGSCAAGRLGARLGRVRVAIRRAAPRACGARRAAGGSAGDAQVQRRVVCEAVAAVGFLLAGHLIGLALRTIRRGAGVSGAAARPPRRAALPEQHNVQFLLSGFRAQSQRRGAPSAAHCRRAAPLCTAARASARAGRPQRRRAAAGGPERTGASHGRCRATLRAAFVPLMLADSSLSHSLLPSLPTEAETTSTISLPLIVARNLHCGPSARRGSRPRAYHTNRASGRSEAEVARCKEGARERAALRRRRVFQGCEGPTA